MKKNIEKLLFLFAFICFFSFSSYAQTALTSEQIVDFQAEIAASSLNSNQKKHAEIMLNWGAADVLREFLDNNGVLVSTANIVVSGTAQLEQREKLDKQANNKRIGGN